MNTLATLIAIAAWCGQPIISAKKVLVEDKFSILYSDYKVDQCRQEIWICLQKTPHNSQCFLKEALDK